MSISVENISKSYGKQLVLDSISFKAKKGEILGFLGPNGAGKTTTMKLITSFTQPDSGSISVCGVDVVSDSHQSKKLIGYLPEHNPLYGNMYIKEFLAFTARLHGIKDSTALIKDLIEKTGLGKEEKKQIRMLSKGYRQRVGLAQALIHDPEVLIFDEPTSGLDPNQLKDIRNLIRELGKEKTVVFSTHIMQEVQALCDRVIIIDSGKIVANDKIKNLDKYTGNNYERIVVEFERWIDDALLTSLSGVKSLERKEGFIYEIDCEAEFEMRKRIFQLSKSKDLPLIGLQKLDVSVENVFQALTK